MIVVACVLLGGLLAPAILTGLGAHRRGMTVPPALLAGLVFPVTWIVWYERDERPHRGPHRDAA